MVEKKGLNYYPLFNKNGKARFFLDADKIHIYSWEGEPVAFVEKGAVFTFDEKHLGWYEDGWLRDKEGKCVAFTEPPGKAGSNPPKTRQPAPPATKKDPPERPAIKEIPPRPIRRALWSPLRDDKFFSPS